MSEVRSYVYPGHVSVVAVHGPIRSSVADADELRPRVWWVARVKVHEAHRRQGLGRRLVAEMLAACGAQDALEVQVAPGGYNMPEGAQRAFYAACGFIPEGPDGLMVWRPGPTV